MRLDCGKGLRWQARMLRQRRLAEGGPAIQELHADVGETTLAARGRPRSAARAEVDSTHTPLRGSAA